MKRIHYLIIGLLALACLGMTPIYSTKVEQPLSESLNDEGKWTQQIFVNQSYTGGTPAVGLGVIYVEGKVAYFIDSDGTATSMIGAGAGISNVVEDLTPQLGGDLDLNSKNLDFPTTANISDVLDDDTLGTASATTLATSESIKAYADSLSGGNVSDNTAEDITGANWEWQDDIDLAFGNDANWLIQYDEAVDDQLLFVTTGTAATATTDPLMQILVGATPTADQRVFGIGKGTQASHTSLLWLDEDGDLTILGAFNVGATPDISFSTDGDGELAITADGDGSDMNLKWNLDDIANTATVTSDSATAVTTINYSSIALQESGIAVINNDEIDASAELYAIMDDETGSGAGALLVFNTSPTFVTSIIMGAATLTEAELEILDGATITTAETDTLSDGSNADSLHVHASAGLSGIVNADLSGSAGITSANILDGVILSGDLSWDAALTDGDYATYDSTGTNFAPLSPSEVLADIGAEVDLVNEAGLYAVLSDVSNFLQTGDALAGDDITDGSVDETELAANSVDSSELVDGGVDASHLAADIVDETKIADNGIDSEHYNDASIDLAHLSSVSVDSDNIVEDTIVNADINSAAAITLSRTAMTAGRSLTISTNDVLADAELYTDTKGVYFEDPTAADDFQSIWRNSTANAVTITEIWAESDQTVNFDLQIDDGTPADVNGTDISPAAGEAEDTSLSGDTTLGVDEELDLVITSVSGTPTWVSIQWTYTWND